MTKCMQKIVVLKSRLPLQMKIIDETSKFLPIETYEFDIYIFDIYIYIYIYIFDIYF